MKKVLIAIMIFLASCFLIGCNSNQDRIISKNIYKSTILRRYGESVIFNIPLITNFEINEYRVEGIHSTLDISYDIDVIFIEEYNDYFSYAVEFSVLTDYYETYLDETLTIDEFSLSLNGARYSYEFGVINILGQFCEYDTDEVLISGQGIYYPNFNSVNIDLVFQSDCTIKGISLTNNFVMLNHEVYLDEYQKDSELSINLSIEEIEETSSIAYEFDIVISYECDGNEKVLSGFSSFKSQIDIINRNYIDKIEAWLWRKP